MKNSRLTRPTASLARKKRLPLRGPVSVGWESFRNSKFERDKDEEGLIRCQDTRIGLPSCSTARSDMDLHHIEGRSGKLLYDETKMVWLTRECHRKAHGEQSPTDNYGNSTLQEE